MLYDFSKKEDVINFSKISSSLMKKISLPFVKNINHPTTLIYTKSVEDLKIFIEKGLNINIPFILLEEQKKNQTLRNNIYHHADISKNIETLDKLKFLYENGFLFEKDMYINIHYLQTHEMRKYYVENIYSYKTKSEIISTLDTIIRHKDYDIFLLFTKKFNINLHDEEIKNLSSFNGKNVFQKAYSCCAYEIAKHLVLHENFDMFECESGYSLTPEQLLIAILEIERENYETALAEKKEIEQNKEKNSLSMLNYILEVIEEYEEKQNMLQLNEDIINEQRQKLKNDILVKDNKNYHKHRI